MLGKRRERERERERDKENEEDEEEIFFFFFLFGMGVGWLGGEVVMDWEERKGPVERAKQGGFLCGRCPKGVGKRNIARKRKEREKKKRSQGG